MYYLLNVTSRPSIRVVSRHRTRGAAEAAEERLQRVVKRANGDSSYLLTSIVEADATAVRNRRGMSEGEAVEAYFVRD